MSREPEGTILNFLKTHSREQLAVAATIACGAAARLVWTSNGQQLKAVTTESHGVAVSLARAGRFADPFGNPAAVRPRMWAC